MKKVLEYVLIFVFAFSLASVSADGKIDKSKIPTDLEYICEFDEEDNCDYIDFEDVVSRLKLKYFEQSWGTSDLEETGDRTVIQLVISGEYSKEEMLAKTILMFDELRNYQMYYSSSGTIYLYIVYNGEVYTLDVMVSIMLNEDVFTINVDTILDGFYEMELLAPSDIDYELIKTYYQEYIDNLTFDGYVLPNYK